MKELDKQFKNIFHLFGLFSEELKKAQETVEKTNFLVITIPSFNYSGSGGIGVNTEEQKVVNVGAIYEPYRAYVRGGLYMIVVGLSVVYLIKYILRYGEVHSGQNIHTDGGKNEWLFI